MQALAEDEYEKALLSAVIPPEEVGVKFDDVGALENVKDALRELVMLPLQRPELFLKGNLTKVMASDPFAFKAFSSVLLVLRVA